MSRQISNTQSAQELIRVGQEGIMPGNDKVIDAYLAKSYVFHGPDGDTDLKGLKTLWDGWREAFSKFTLTREQIVVEGNMIGARNTFSGKFEKELKTSAVGPIKPNGKQISLEVINTFRYDSEGLLAEEWVQYDNISFLKQLGVQLKRS